MFLGTYNAQLSEGGRLSIPKKIRREVQNGEVILFTRFEQCIFGFNKDTWQEITRTELEKPFFVDGDGRDMRRKVNMSATVATMDAQSRIVIPDTMLHFASISDAIVIIGAGDHFEIWNKKIWEEYSKEL